MKIENANHSHEKVIEIADRTWWVGHYLENDSFQCHTYLIENGNQSVLLDPGSIITYKETRRKIGEIVSFDQIRYFVCHHQDPDIVSAISLFDEEVTRDDAVIVTHWRAIVLLKHYGWKLPFLSLDDTNWELLLEDRKLKFLFTPYLHFPGAFCTFDERTGVLFSSDLFGGFSNGFQLFAKDDGHIETVRLFHEHYMPSRELLQHSLTALQEYPISMIAPQHGSIIQKPLINFMINKLKEIECGLFTSSPMSIDISRHSRLNIALRDITHALMVCRNLSEIVEKIMPVLQRFIPQSKDMELFAQTEQGEYLSFTKDSRYKATMRSNLRHFKNYMSMDIKAWKERYENLYLLEKFSKDNSVLIIPLFQKEGGKVNGIAAIELTGDIVDQSDIQPLIDHMGYPLWVAIEREILFHNLEKDRKKYYLQSIRDSLTGLFTRFYMEDAVQRLIGLRERNEYNPLSVAIFDIDHFKQVNDKYGHVLGDVVLKKVGEILKDQSRAVDIPVRLGGEEFAVFLPGVDEFEAVIFAERIRNEVSRLVFDDDLCGLRITISAGVTEHRSLERLTDFIERCDSALYTAKNKGRNNVCRS